MQTTRSHIMTGLLISTSLLLSPCLAASSSQGEPPPEVQIRRLERKATILEAAGEDKGRDNYQYRSVLTSLIHLYEGLGQMTKVEETYQRVLHMDPDSIYILSDFAQFLERAQRFDEAEKYFKRALEVESGLSTPDSKDSESNEMKTLIEQALVSGKPRSISVAPHSLQSTQWLADFYIRRRRYTEAEEIYKPLLQARREALADLPVRTGLSHFIGSDRFWDMYNLASALEQIAAPCKLNGKFPEAQKYLEEAIQLREEIQRNRDQCEEDWSGTDQRGMRELIGDWFNLAEVLVAQGRSADAEPLYWRVLSEKTRLFPSPYVRSYVFEVLDPLKVVSSLNGLGTKYLQEARALASNGKSVEAAAAYQKAIDIFSKVAGENQPNVDTFWQRTGLSNFSGWSDSGWVCNSPKLRISEVKARAHAQRELLNSPHANERLALADKEYSDFQRGQKASE